MSLKRRQYLADKDQIELQSKIVNKKNKKKSALRKYSTASHLTFSCTFHQGKHKFKSQIWFISFCWSYFHIIDLEPRFSRNKIWSLPPFKGQSNILHNIGGQSEAERAMMLKISLIINPDNFAWYFLQVSLAMIFTSARAMPVPVPLWALSPPMSTKQNG